MTEAHQHTRPPTDVEHEISEAFTSIGINPADCLAYARAKADRCLDCQDRLLAEAAADPNRAGVLYHFFYVAVACHFGENAIVALSYRNPQVGPVATKVAAAEFDLWGESTVPTADAITCAQTVLAECNAEEREACPGAGEPGRLRRAPAAARHDRGEPGRPDRLRGQGPLDRLTGTARSGMLPV